MEVEGNPIRVQCIMQDGKMVVPPQYVQPPEIRAQHNSKKISLSNNCDAPTPPVIDLSNADILSEQLELACREWGAFHIINHGVPIRLLDDMRTAGRSFFEDCSMDQKLSFSCDANSPAPEGYGSRMLVASNDTVLDWRDYFDHHSLPLSRRNPSQWPNFSPNYR